MLNKQIVKLTKSHQKMHDGTRVEWRIPIRADKSHHNTTTEYIIANAPSPPVCFEPAVTVYNCRFQMDPAVMLTYHRRFVIRPGGDMLASPSVHNTTQR